MPSHRSKSTNPPAQDRQPSPTDCAHPDSRFGTAHQDLLTATGKLREKHKFPHENFDEAPTGPSTISRRATKTIRIKHRIVTLSPEEKKGLAKNVPELLRYLKSIGAVPISPALKRRLIAAGAWDMPDE